MFTHTITVDPTLKRAGLWDSRLQSSISYKGPRAENPIVYGMIGMLEGLIRRLTFEGKLSFKINNKESAMPISLGTVATPSQHLANDLRNEIRQIERLMRAIAAGYETHLKLEYTIECHLNP